MATQPRLVEDEYVVLSQEELDSLSGISLNEFLSLPEVKPALEYVEGRVTQKVSPQGKHSRLQSGLVQLFDGITRPGKVALAFPELRFRGARYSPVPDVSVFRWERIPRDPDGTVADVFSIPPDVAMEILSPGESRRQQVDKCLGFLERGTRAALFVDDVRRTITLFRPGTEPTPLQTTDVIDLTYIVPGLRFTVDDVFATLRLD
jgi:Uma2 family endonuclease